MLIILSSGDLDQNDTWNNCKKTEQAYNYCEYFFGWLSPYEGTEPQLVQPQTAHQQ